MAKKKDVKSTKSTEVAKVTDDQVTDLAVMGVSDIPSMLDKVTKQIDAITVGLPSGPKTSVSLNGFGLIEKIDTVETLIKAAATVMSKQEGYNNAVKLILDSSVKVPEFKLSGVLAEDWLLDIKARVLIVANKEKLDRLNKIKTKLEANLSAKDKFAKDMAAIQAILLDE